MNEPTCTCDERRWTVCHEMGTEPHLAGCPRWGWLVRPFGPTREWDTADAYKADRRAAGEGGE